MTVLRHWGVALAALASLSATGVAGAQGKPAAKPPEKACTITYDKPDEIKDAYSNLNKAVFYQLPEQKKKPLTQAVEKLTLREDHYALNANAQDYLLGEALILWSTIPGVGDMPKRGTLGFLGDKEQPIDLLKTADSLFTLVEKAVPLCKEDISTYRQMAWAPIINQVGPLLNAGKLDSAQALLARANVIYRDSPFNYYFAGQIYYRQDKDKLASEAYEKEVPLGNTEIAANPSDANMKAITEWSAFFAGYTGQRAAATMTGADQVAEYKHVIELFQAYLKAYGCAQYAEPAQNGVFDAMRQIGDTAGVRAELTKLSDQTSACSDMSWYNAARDAHDIGATPLAVKLADKAVANSPWSAGLGNAAAVYFDAKEWDKLMPVAVRLTQISPNTPDSYQEVAQAYLGYAGAKSATAAKKKAYTDSATTWYETGEKLDVNVRITQFTSDGAKRVVGGTVKLVDHTPGAGAKAGKGAKGGKSQPSASAPKPRVVTIKMDLLDKTGAVVLSKSVDVNASVEATKFELAAEGDKIVGYKYALIH